MRKQLRVLVAMVAVLGAATFSSCSKNDGAPVGTIAFLTFEDSDYSGTGNYLGKADWSSLIDNPQYGGELLYGEVEGQNEWGPIYAGTEYKWYDEKNTGLFSKIAVGYDGKAMLWNGGMAVSNYIDSDLNNGTYDKQLAIPFKSGHNGSKNFCVAKAGTSFSFADGEAKIVDHLYIAPTTYFANVANNGNYFTGNKGADWVKITAVGCDANGDESGTLDFYIVKDGKMIDSWTKWSLASLGEVEAVSFSMSGDQVNDYGMVQPSYFAFDDVCVVTKF